MSRLGILLGGFGELGGMAPKLHCSPVKGAMRPHGSTAGLTAGAGFTAKAGLTAALLASQGLSKKAGLTAGAGLAAKRQRPAPENPMQSDSD